jgi:hypothetical protein
VAEVAHRDDGAVGGARFDAFQRRCVRAGELAETAHDPLVAEGGVLLFAVLARRLAGQLEEDVVERRSAQAHITDADTGPAELGGGLLDKKETLPRGWQGQPVRPRILLRRATANANERRLGLVTLLDVG